MNKSILSFEKERILVSCAPKDESTIPQPILAKCVRIETIPYSNGDFVASPLSELDVYQMNNDLYGFLWSYIQLNWPSYWYDPDSLSLLYNPNPQGWVYLESVDTEVDTFFEKVEGGYNSASLYTLSARIVFYENNNIPASSPSGV